MALTLSWPAAQVDYLLAHYGEVQTFHAKGHRATHARAPHV